MRKLAAEELFEYAVKYLGARACSTEELRTRLRRRAANSPDVDAAIGRLKDIGYLDDRRFAESYASVRAESNGFGPRRVLSDLRSRRVSGKLAEKAVERAFEGKDEAGMIDAFIERRMSSLILAAQATGGRIEDERKLAAAYRRLLRSGFSPGASIAALKRIAARPELIEEPPPEEEEEESDGLDSAQ